MTTDHHAPVDGSANIPKLADSALGAFRALLWGGLTALALAVIAAIIGFNNGGYGEELAQVGAFSFSGSALLWAIILLTGSGVIAGLGARVPHSTPVPVASGSPQPPASANPNYGTYVPADE